MSDGQSTDETYRDPCPKCGAQLIGFTKEDYIAHLRENGEMLAAKIEEELVVDRSDCGDANPTEDAEVCADATGAQRDYCPECGRYSIHHVEAKAGENGTVSKKSCNNCGAERVEWCVRAETDHSRGGER
jgi:predicted RNA-binding Zn-ribbon protein involved in translation (DUF1610 family)